MEVKLYQTKLDIETELDEPVILSRKLIATPKTLSGAKGTASKWASDKMCNLSMSAGTGAMGPWKEVERRKYQRTVDWNCGLLTLQL